MTHKFLDYSLAVTCECSHRVSEAKGIAAHLDVPFFLGVPLGLFDLILVITSERLELRSGQSELGPVYVDFMSGALNYRLRTKGQNRDLLLRAIGGKGKKVLDLTAGFLGDSFLLASQGCHVTAIERSEIVGLLVKDALARARRDPELNFICENIDFRIAEGDSFLTSSTQQSWDVIFLDPMFPEKKKSSLPKKELQILQLVVGPGDEAESQRLLGKALQQARKVVVKRPMAAAPLLNGVSSVIKGRSVRFDTYFFKQLWLKQH